MMGGSYVVRPVSNRFHSLILGGMLLVLQEHVGSVNAGQIRS